MGCSNSSSTGQIKQVNARYGSGQGLPVNLVKDTKEPAAPSPAAVALERARRRAKEAAARAHGHRSAGGQSPPGQQRQSPLGRGRSALSMSSMGPAREETKAPWTDIMATSGAPKEAQTAWASPLHKGRAGAAGWGIEPLGTEVEEGTDTTESPRPSPRIAFSSAEHAPCALTPTPLGDEVREDPCAAFSPPSPSTGGSHVRSFGRPETSLRSAPVSSPPPRVLFPKTADIPPPPPPPDLPGSRSPAPPLAEPAPQLNVQPLSSVGSAATAASRCDGVDDEANAQREFLLAANQLSPAELREFVLEHVNSEIAEVRRLPQEQRVQAFRSLCAEWHPDKCPAIVGLATDIFKHLQAEKAAVLAA